jgi:diaminopimelate decarboxylase
MDSSFLPELRGILRKYSKNLELKGVTLHVGSQLRDLSGILEAIQKTIPVYLDFKNSGYPVETFDVGGGLGISYDGSNGVSVEDYASKVLELLSPLGCRILTEPGRLFVGPHGILLGEVQYIKMTPYKNFAILNTGMHHLLRPALYQAFHRIEKVTDSISVERASRLYDVVGPICESSDVIGRDRYLPELDQGDILVIRDVGAYGYSMASFYNAHALPKEVVIQKGKTIYSKQPHLPLSWRS